MFLNWGGSIGLGDDVTQLLRLENQYGGIVKGGLVYEDVFKQLTMRD